MFTSIWRRFPFWLIFFRWVETTNQTTFGLVNWGWLGIYVDPAISLWTPKGGGSKGSTLGCCGEGVVMGVADTKGKGQGWVEKVEAGQFLRCVISYFVWKADVFFLWMGWNAGFLLGCLIEKSIWFHFIKCVSMQAQIIIPLLPKHVPPFCATSQQYSMSKVYFIWFTNQEHLSNVKTLLLSIILVV